MSEPEPAHAQKLLRSCPVCRAIYRTDFDRCPSDGGTLEVTDQDPLIGCVLADRYVIESLIGEGGIARVYRASHRRLAHKRVAIKVMFGDFASTLQMRMRFTREAETASRLAHPNVVSAFDLGRTPEGLMYLAMELVEGRTLGEVIDDEGPFGVPRTIAIARQLCEGLAYAHDQGLVHRDFKPDNVLIVGGTTGEVARITDFGLAITVDLDRDVRFTAAGYSVGTPIYAAPEQTYDESAIDHRADLFSLGVTLYEMLAGKPPYDGNMLDLLRQNAQGKPPSIKERSGLDVPEALEALVLRMLAPTPAARPNSVREVLVELEQIALGPAAVISLPHPVAATVQTPPRMTPRLRGGVIGGSLAVVITAAFLWNAGRTDTPVVTAAPAVASLPVVATLPPPTARVERSAQPPTEEASSALPPVIARATPSPARDRSGSAGPPGRTANAVRAVAGRQRVAATQPDAQPEPPTSSEEADPVLPVPPPVEAAPPPAVVPPPVAPPPVAPPQPLRPPAVRIDNLTVRGSLATSVVRRALERVQPSFVECYARLGGRLSSDTATVTFSIDEDGRIVDVATVAGATAVADCLRTTSARARAASPPDVGTVRVSMTLAMTRGAP